VDHGEKIFGIVVTVPDHSSRERAWEERCRRKIRFGWGLRPSGANQKDQRV
jgi:hypothetical protein